MPHPEVGCYDDIHDICMPTDEGEINQETSLGGDWNVTVRYMSASKIIEACHKMKGFIEGLAKLVKEQNERFKKAKDLFK